MVWFVDNLVMWATSLLALIHLTAADIDISCINNGVTGVGTITSFPRSFLPSSPLLIANLSRQELTLHNYTNSQRCIALVSSGSGRRLRIQLLHRSDDLDRNDYFYFYNVNNSNIEEIAVVHNFEDSNTFITCEAPQCLIRFESDGQNSGHSFAVTVQQELFYNESCEPGLRCKEGLRCESGNRCGCLSTIPTEPCQTLYDDDFPCRYAPFNYTGDGVYDPLPPDNMLPTRAGMVSDGIQRHIQYLPGTYSRQCFLRIHSSRGRPTLVTPIVISTEAFKDPIFLYQRTNGFWENVVTWNESVTFPGFGYLCDSQECLMRLDFSILRSRSGMLFLVEETLLPGENCTKGSLACKAPATCNGTGNGVYQCVQDAFSTAFTTTASTASTTVLTTVSSTLSTFSSTVSDSTASTRACCNVVSMLLILCMLRDTY